MKLEAWCAFAAHDEMERVREYLAAGRGFADATDAELVEWWREARRDFLVQPSEDTCEPFLEMDAELRLRDLEPPEIEVSATDRLLIERNLRVALSDPGVQQRLKRDIEAFYEHWHSATRH